jgi:hypothetical protein
MKKLRVLFARNTKTRSTRKPAKASLATPTSGRKGSARASVGKDRSKPLK